MTLAELERAILSKQRIQKKEAQEKASFDYILADLVGRSISRLYSSSNTYPDISEVFPTLFDSQEISQKKQEAKAKMSALRFMKFADSHNKRFKQSQEV